MSRRGGGGWWCLYVCMGEIQRTTARQKGSMVGSRFAKGKQFRVAGASSRWPFYAGGGGKRLNGLCGSESKVETGSVQRWPSLSSLDLRSWGLQQQRWTCCAVLVDVRGSRRQEEKCGDGRAGS